MHWKLVTTILSISALTQVQSFRFRIDNNDLSLSKSNESEVKVKSEQILEKLLLPTDSKLEKELKLVVAEYLAETLKSNEIGRSGYGRAMAVGTTYSKHHHWSHRDRYNQQVVQQQQQVVSIPAVQNPPVAAQQTVPVIAPVQQVQQAPVVPAVQQAQPVAVVPPVQQAESVAVPVNTQPAPVEAARAPESVISPTQATAPPAVPVITGQPAAAVASPAPVQAQPQPQLPAQPQPQLPAQVQPQPQPPIQQVVQIPVTVPTTTRRPRPTVDPNHALNQVDKILGNVANGNIVGIVDESLRIRAPEPVRNLVTNILKIVFCNPIDRFFGRCAQNQINAANTSQ